MADMDDLFSSMFGGFGFDFEDGPSAYGSFDTAGAGPSRRKPSRGKDTIVDYHVSLEEVYKGKRVVMNLERDRKCSHCKGQVTRCACSIYTDCGRTGGRNGVKPTKCGQCSGKGVVIQDRHARTSCISVA